MMPVADGPFLAGQLTQGDIAAALAAEVPRATAVSELMRRGPLVVRPHASVREALALFRSSGESSFVVVDDFGRVIGLLTPSDLVAPTGAGMRPRMVGGMATPFGVYLTNGVIKGGVSNFALIATGALLFGLFFFATLAADWIVGQAGLTGQSWAASLTGFLSAVFFLGTLRSIPLTGIHAAEHMVVHAIERGEPLEPAIVSRMPRVHPRCGTNLAAAASLFMGVATWDAIPQQDLRLLLALIVTIALWRPLGSALQYYVTTKPPTPKQLALGIAAGTELLREYRRTRTTIPTVGARLWRSGLFQIMIGSVCMALAVQQIATWLGWGQLVRVY